MFCQAHNNKEVHRVETLEKSADVLERTATDPLMSIRLPGVCVLIAAEGCYHLTCLITFERRCMKAKASMVSLDNETDECMTKLSRELSAGLSRGMCTTCWTYGENMRAWTEELVQLYQRNTCREGHPSTK